MENPLGSFFLVIVMKRGFRYSFICSPITEGKKFCLILNVQCIFGTKRCIFQYSCGGSYIRPTNIEEQWIGESLFISN